jgi:uncharacterized protein YciI
MTGTSTEMIMKIVLNIIILILSSMAFGQANFPDFLAGTWKMENKEIYEHWDKLNSQQLKGFSYQFDNGQISVTEYLEIAQKGNDVVYTASVINQNLGKGIDFKLIQTDSTFVFENPSHDFPQKISYQKLSDKEIFVQVSDGNQREFSYNMHRQIISSTPTETTNSNPNYDRTLAEKLGADDYGMKSYFFVILKTGTNTSADQELIRESFRGHMENIRKLVDEGKLIVAGPMGKNDNNYRGIFILNNIESIEEAKEFLQTDPAIKNNLLDVDVYKWYGSAALPEYLPFSDKIWKMQP